MSIDAFCTIPATPAEAWRYFTAPGALPRLSPPFLSLRPVREAASLRDGEAVLEPRTALPGPLAARFGPQWVARHEPDGFVDGERFVDRCVTEPYASATVPIHAPCSTAAPRKSSASLQYTSSPTALSPSWLSCGMAVSSSRTV